MSTAFSVSGSNLIQTWCFATDMLFYLKYFNRGIWTGLPRRPPRRTYQVVLVTTKVFLVTTSECPKSRSAVFFLSPAFPTWDTVCPSNFGLCFTEAVALPAHWYLSEFQKTPRPPSSALQPSSPLLSTTRFSGICQQLLPECRLGTCLFTSTQYLFRFIRCVQHSSPSPDSTPHQLTALLLSLHTATGLMTWFKNATLIFGLRCNWTKYIHAPHYAPTWL